MDAGAHFHRCDLQIHSPRDNDWVGECPANEEERKAYAREFVAACRDAGLEAIAITDHHDVAFFPYIRQASLDEKDSHGLPVPPSNQIIVFPGLELTLGVPCQALLLFEPDTSEADLHRAMAALGITHALRDLPKADPVQRLSIDDLNEIYRRLNEHDTLRDRFILLPNVNEGGADTILRTGFFDKYKRMTCVGGYVDGSCRGHGKRLILDGKDPNWGSKRLGLLQTSDSRNRDFSRLGIHPTWIKWSIPSTEALRQACLAPDSRIRYDSPLLPDNFILKIEVSNSKYFGSFSLEFNSQFNAIIGGRGSGKSTILEYLRWAMCDQPYVHHEEEGTELPDFEKRRRSLISGTLKLAGGDVSIHYMRHGVPHRIRREGGTGKVFLKVADQGESEAAEETIQSLAQIQGYSQKQLSHVSTRTRELIRLLKIPIAQDLATNKSQFDASSSDLRQVFERHESRRNLLSQLHAVEQDLTSKREQIRSLTEAMRDLPPEQQNDINAHPLYVEGERLATSFSTTIQSAASYIRTATTSIQRLLSDLPVLGSARPHDILALIRSKVDAALNSVVSQLEASASALSDVTDEVKGPAQNVADEIDSHKARYQSASSENAGIQQRLDSLRTLSDEAAAVEIEKTALDQKVAEIGAPDAELSSARERWRAAVEREIALLEQQAVRLTTDSNGSLRVRIDKAKDNESLRRSLLSAVQGAAITVPEKFDNLVRRVSESADPLSAWINLGEELIALARVGPQLSTGAELPPSPRLTAAGFIHSELRRIAPRLNPVTAFQLTLQYAESVPVFEYRTADGTYVPFEDASPGQQATALIGLLLNQTAGPLVVDQPEDDLDNSTILLVAERLWAAKEKRQVIFTTHNPNLVVIGDAELVVHCAYAHPGQTAKVHIADQGAIDSAKVCEAITKVMEGGEEAFRLRKERYGF